MIDFGKKAQGSLQQAKNATKGSSAEEVAAQERAAAIVYALLDVADAIRAKG